MFTTIIFSLLSFVLGAAMIWLLKDGDIKSLKVRLEGERRHIEAMHRRMEERQQAELQRVEQQRRDDERNWSVKLEALKQELLKITAQQLAESSRELSQNNGVNLNELLQPLRQQFEDFKSAVDATRVQSEVNKKSIEERFASTLQMFQLQQENAIKRLQEQTSKIGNDAVALAEALKTNTKRQGNWGEMVLQTMLENSGLEEGAHFFVQYNVEDSEGNRQIPDVVVKFPEGRSIIIDSKVSLTSYTQYFETEDEDRRQKLLLSHLRSVEKHINELSAKQYQRTVENSMDYVLMFIPNESSYVMALKLNPNLLSEAYAKKVIVISPNNLMMTLQLAFNMWQTDKQAKNIERIIKRGQLLYDKVVGFQASFDSVGDAINALQASYENARKQAYTGAGNIIRQCEKLRELGVPVGDKKRLRLED